MGQRMKDVASRIAQFSQSEISQLEAEGRLNLPLETGPAEIFLQDVEISSDDIPGYLVSNKGSLTVALDIQLSDVLIQEGLAREFVNKVQKLRKDLDFALTDRLQIQIQESELLTPALIQFKSYICTEILADTLEISPEIQHGTAIEVNDHVVHINISKL